MESVIRNVLRKHCDIDEASLNVLPSYLIKELQPYIKQMPSLKDLTKSDLYGKLLSISAIDNILCGVTTCAILFTSPVTNNTVVNAVEGHRYGKNYHYPMYVHVVKVFEDNLVVLELL